MKGDRIFQNPSCFPDQKQVLIKEIEKELEIKV
jgi:hypothetical protein